MDGPRVVGMRAERPHGVRAFFIFVGDLNNSPFGLPILWLRSHLKHFIVGVAPSAAAVGSPANREGRARGRFSVSPVGALRLEDTLATPTIPASGLFTHCLAGSTMPTGNSFDSRSTLSVGGKAYTIYKLAAVEKEFPQAKKLPYSLKILLENLLRNEDGSLAVRQGRHRSAGPLEAQGRAERGDRLHPGPRAPAGLHRRARASSIWPPCATP